MLTRKQYLDSASDEHSRHNEYYTQFVTNDIIDTLLVTFGHKAIVSSTDEHFNDLPLKIWNNMPLYMECVNRMKAVGDFGTLSGKVCIYKAAAEKIRLNHKEKQ